MTPTSSARRPLLTSLLAVLALVAACLGGMSSTATAVPSAPAPTSAGAGAAPSAAVTAAARRACRVVKRQATKRVTKRVTARRGEAAGTRAGRKAGRKAYRRCLRVASTTPVVPVTPTTPGTPTPTTPGGPSLPPTPGDPSDPTPPAGPTYADGCLTSVPDPGTTAPVQICFTVFRPAGAGAGSRVPLVLHSHGWGGSRTTDPAAFAPYLDRGYGVLSFDQRGFGESGGQAYVENPDVEGKDVLAIVDHVARLPWVQLDAPGDPRLGAIGGSYGGGYQFLTAFETRTASGRSAIDAMAPEITWFDLQESLAPQDVVRTAWALALTAAAQPSNAMPPQVVQGLALGVLTGSFPDSLEPFFEKNGPKWQVAHRGGPLDVPMLLGQGTTDGLFPLEQGFQNFQRSLTDAARARSIFVGYNGGHVIPPVVPAGTSLTSDPCSAELTGGGDFQALTLRFLDEQLKGRPTGLTGYGRYHLATPQDTCVDVASVQQNTVVPVPGVIGNLVAPIGAPVSTPVAPGPITVAGTPTLEGDVTSLGLDDRLFLGLGIGTSPLDVRLVQNNMLPLRSTSPGVSVHRTDVALPSVAVEVPAGQNLYLVASPLQDTFVAMGSRVPSAMVIQNIRVRLPVVR